MSMPSEQEGGTLIPQYIQYYKSKSVLLAPLTINALTFIARVVIASGLSSNSAGFSVMTLFKNEFFIEMFGKGLFDFVSFFIRIV